MQINFFTWIREGVKQSVLMGVSDAVEQMGAPPQGDDASQQLLSFLRQPAIDDKGENTSGRTRSKRLGRSLKDVAK